jgi:hypothetical protein
MLWEPHLEGANVGATAFETYFQDPFLAYVYLASIPFFVALYKAFKLLGYIRENRAFAPESVLALRTIKRCALSLIGLIMVAEIWIRLAWDGKDDMAGGVAMGAVAIFISTIIAAKASVLEGILQNRVDIKY